MLKEFNLYPYLTHSKESPEKTLLGISLADAAIAETGGVVEFYRNNQEKLVSILPEYHFVILRTENIKESLDDLLKNIPPGVDFTIITGPSKTADIEKTVVKGAHGPRELFIFILEK